MALMSLRQSAQSTGIRYSALLYYYQRGKLEAEKIGTVAVIEASTLVERMRELGYTPKAKKAQEL